MRDIIKLFIVVALFAAVAGGVLAKVRDVTLEPIEKQVIYWVTGPALDKLFKGSENVPKEDKFKIQDGKNEIDVFVAEFDGKRNMAAFESSGMGYDGKVGVMVGFNLDTDELVGMGITTHTETQGIGSRAETDTNFINQFKGMSVDTGFKVKTDGGDVDALSGATFTSKGVCAAVADAVDKYKRLKDEIRKKM